MSHAFVTVIAPVRHADMPSVRSELENLQNPARADIETALNRLGLVHFASINVFTASSGRGGYLVLEFSGDGSPDDLLAQLANAIEAWLAPVFRKAEDFAPGQSLGEYWRSKTVTLGQGYFSTAGLVFTGTPGMSVRRIQRESGLAKQVSDLLPALLPSASALSVLERVREKLRASTDHDWVWEAQPTPMLGVERPLVKAILPVLGLGLVKYLWPLILIPGATAILVAILRLQETVSGSKLLDLRRDLIEFIAIFGMLLVVELILLVYALYKFTQTEESDQPEDRNPASAQLADIAKRENHYAQNHLDVHTVLKDEPLRGTALRLAFFVIGQFCARQFKPGFLGSIGSIHFARWVLVPGTRDLLFFSNYGGSWESYLEDFITKAHAGLTAVWSNTIGFPRARFLFSQGATDGDRFKRWARTKQVPTPFWYSAYPHLTTTSIRNNAMICQGLAGASTEEEARDWLSLFGSAPRPPDSLETEEIQSLLFGSLSPLEESECILFRLADGPQACGRWLSHVLPDISFGERLPERSALMLGITRSLLERCDVPYESIASFPNAFLQGMTEPSRSRILGDAAENQPLKWLWGGPRSSQFDGVAMVYGKNKSDLDNAKQQFLAGLNKFGHECVWTIALKSAPRFGERTEPFGFRDGISQPVIRGTLRTQRAFDRIHLVEPGEFILGYPDNRGYIPPTPQISAMLDPDNLLPLVPGSYDSRFGFSHPVSEIGRDLGRNGSFLVIRQLEQDVEKFRSFLKEAAATQFRTGDEPADPGFREKWIAAKLVGRWTDGSSLVRNPSIPASDKRKTSAAAVESSQEKHTPDNSFLFGAEDPQGLRCPFGAHIRRANPRDSFAPGSAEQIAITNRHRILRSGRRYEEPQTGKQGLLFICLNADLERQFEFIQQTWILNPTFQGLSGEADPLFRGDHSGSFTIPTISGPMRVQGLSSFVKVRGGAYFFLPGKRTLAFLAKHAGNHRRN